MQQVNWNYRQELGRYYTEKIAFILKIRLIRFVDIKSWTFCFFLLSSIVIYVISADTNRLRSENSQRRQQEEQPLTPYMPFLSGLPDRTVINQMTIQYYITVPFQGGLQIPQLPVPAAEPGTMNISGLKMAEI